MSIQPLPEDVIRRIRSSATITSLNGVVCSLLKNCLDAGATRINITVDYSRGNCVVEDDGQGIVPSEFRENGGLAKLYHTSRRSSGNDFYGINGNFLASLSALSLLSITSHHHSHNNQSCMTIHNSKVLARSIPALPEQRLLTFDHGTRVVVRDLFGSMAVRVKQRAAASERASVDKDWTRLMYDLTAILLAWPHSATVFVRDALYDNQKRFRPNFASKSDGDFDLRSYLSLTIAQSGLVDSSDIHSWISVGASLGTLTLDGCIALNPVASRRAQFISLGIRPVANEHGINVLYTEVNRVFINSGFAIIEESRSSGDQAAGQGADAAKSRRPKRGSDRWPMFYFRLGSTSAFQSDLPESAEDLLGHRNRDLADIVDLLKLVCYEFLKKHHFRPHKVATSLKSSHQKRKPGGNSTEDAGNNGRKRLKHATLDSNRSKSATPGSRPDTPFDHWQRVKGWGASEAKTMPTSSNPEADASGVKQCKSSIGSSRELFTLPKLGLLNDPIDTYGRPFRELPSLPPLKEYSKLLCPETLEKDTRLHALEPPSNLAIEEKPRPPQSPFNAHSEAGSSENGVALAFRHFQKTRAEPRKESSEWLASIMSKWENPVFQPVEPSIPRIDDANSAKFGGELCPGGRSDENGCRHGTHVSNIKLSGRISRAALANAEVVSQVDQKFILVKVRREQTAGTERAALQENSVMVLIDQHAADERCRLEALMQGYLYKLNGSDVFARTEVLERPMRFEFSAKECTLLWRYMPHFHHWGIRYMFSGPDADQWQQRSEQLSKVEVTSLPPSILERCKTEPPLLAEILRDEIWKLDQDGKTIVRPLAPGTSGDEGEINWVSRFHGCPQGILDLLNSRACRTAIMFNDILSKDECENLVRRLAQCSFPFQCAHGRPSMVPLVDTRNLVLGNETYHGGPLRSFGRRLKESGLIR